MISEFRLRDQCKATRTGQRKISERTWQVLSYPGERTSMNDVPPFFLERDMRRKRRPFGSGH